MSDTENEDPCHLHANHSRVVAERSKLCTERSANSRLTPADLVQYTQMQEECTEAATADNPMKVQAHTSLCETLMHKFVGLMDECSQAATEQAAMEAAMEMDQALRINTAQSSTLKRLRAEIEDLKAEKASLDRGGITASAFKRYKDFYIGCRELQRDHEGREQGARSTASADSARDVQSNTNLSSIAK